RHTRSTRDWSSDVCSSDLNAEHLAMRDRVAMVDLSAFAILDIAGPAALDFTQRMAVKQMDVPVGRVVYTPLLNPAGGVKADLTRSEERRVGKECRSRRWSQ